MNDKGKPVDPNPPEENEEVSSHPDSGFFPEKDPEEDELAKFLISQDWL